MLLYPKSGVSNAGLSCVAPRSDFSAVPGPVGVEELAARLIHALVRVRAEIIALGLKEVGRKPFAPVAVIKRQRSAEGRHRNSLFYSGRDCIAPGTVRAIESFAEKRIQHQVGKLGMFRERFLDLSKENAA